jgi:hypothetical protein
MFKFIISDITRVLEALELIIKSGNYTMQSYVKNNEICFDIYINNMKYVLNFNIITTDNMHMIFEFDLDRFYNTLKSINSKCEIVVYNNINLMTISPIDIKNNNGNNKKSNNIYAINIKPKINNINYNDVIYDIKYNNISELRLNEELFNKINMYETKIIKINHSFNSLSFEFDTKYENFIINYKPITIEFSIPNVLNINKILITPVILSSFKNDLCKIYTNDNTLKLEYAYDNWKFSTII